MSTLAIVEDILRESNEPLSVRDIVGRAGPALPTKSKTPDTVVARDLAMDIKRKGEGSLFARTSPGRYTLRARVSESTSVTTPSPILAAGPSAEPTPMSQALGGDRAGTRPATPAAKARDTSMLA